MSTKEMEFCDPTVIKIISMNSSLFVFFVENESIDIDATVFKPVQPTFM